MTNIPTIIITTIKEGLNKKIKKSVREGFQKKEKKVGKFQHCAWPTNPPPMLDKENKDFMVEIC